MLEGPRSHRIRHHHGATGRTPVADMADILVLEQSFASLCVHLDTLDTLEVRQKNKKQVMLESGESGLMFPAEVVADPAKANQFNSILA